MRRRLRFLRRNTANHLTIEFRWLVLTLHKAGHMLRTYMASLTLALGLSACTATDEQPFPYPCPQAPETMERNPRTGQCESRGSVCVPGAHTPQTHGKGAVGWLSLEPWAACYGRCDGLDDASCRADDACQLGYLDGEVWGCWELNPTQVADGDCATLEAVGCTTRNDCVPHYANVEYQDWAPKSNSSVAPPRPTSQR